MNPVARLAMYEVAEALRFREVALVDGRTAYLRVARATLLGHEIEPLRPETPFTPGRWVIASARSAIDLTRLRGPVRGRFAVLDDIDPDRRSLDTLMVSASGSLRGVLDLKTALDGYARFEGRWSMPAAMLTGRFRGLFLIPFQIPGSAGYWYREREPASGGPSPGAGPGTLRGLTGDEFALGVPLTRAVVVLFAGQPAERSDGERRWERAADPRLDVVAATAPPREPALTGGR